MDSKAMYALFEEWLSSKKKKKKKNEEDGKLLAKISAECAMEGGVKVKKEKTKPRMKPLVIRDENGVFTVADTSDEEGAEGDDDDTEAEKDVVPLNSAVEKDAVTDNKADDDDDDAEEENEEDGARAVATPSSSRRTRQKSRARNKAQRKSKSKGKGPHQKELAPDPSDVDAEAKIDAEIDAEIDVRIMEEAKAGEEEVESKTAGKEKKKAAVAVGSDVSEDSDTESKAASWSPDRIMWQLAKNGRRATIEKNGGRDRCLYHGTVVDIDTDVTPPTMTFIRDANKRRYELEWVTVGARSVWVEIVPYVVNIWRVVMAGTLEEEEESD